MHAHVLITSGASERSQAIASAEATRLQKAADAKKKAAKQLGKDHHQMQELLSKLDGCSNLFASLPDADVDGCDVLLSHVTQVTCARGTLFT